MNRSRHLLAFKRGPTVDLQLDDLIVEVRADRIHLSLGADSEYLSWEEWRDFARRVDHAIEWITEHTPADVAGRSFTVEDGDG